MKRYDFKVTTVINMSVVAESEEEAREYVGETYWQNDADEYDSELLSVTEIEERAD